MPNLIDIKQFNQPKLSGFFSESVSQISGEVLGYASGIAHEVVSGQAVLLSGQQDISGVKNFISRPTVNDSGVLLQGEIDPSSYYTKNNPSGFITGVNLSNYVTRSNGQFIDRPTVNGTGVLLIGEVPTNVNNPTSPQNLGSSSFVDTTGQQTISGSKTFLGVTSFKENLNLEKQNGEIIFTEGLRVRAMEGRGYISGNMGLELKAGSNKVLIEKEDGNAVFIESPNIFLTSRPLVNGTGILLSGEAAGLPNTIAYTTGNQTISGVKTFATGIIAPNLVYNIGDQTISGNKTFNEEVVFDNNGNTTFHGGLTISEGTLAAITVTGFLEQVYANNLVYNTGNQNISGTKTFINNQIFSGNIGVSGTGIFNAIDLNNIDNLSLSGVDITITSGIVNLTNRPTVNNTGVLLSGENIVTAGKTIYVDAGVGTDSRQGLSKYDLEKPFQTISAAVSASAIGDLVWIRKNSYNISASISLDDKGDIQCEAGTIITITGNITAFTTSQTKTIIGDTFILSDTAKLCDISGGTLRFEFSSLNSTSTGTLFTVTAGTIDMQFASIVATSARAFELTGSGSMRIRRSHSVSCQQFLYANTTGGATIDLWTVIGNSPDSVFYIDNIVGLSYRGVNCNGSVGQNTYSNGYIGATNWASNLAAGKLLYSDTNNNSIRLDSEDSGGLGYAINNATAQITSPSRYSFGSKLKWNASNLAGSTWYGVGGLVLSQGRNISQNYLFIGLQPVLDDTWARPFIEYRLGSKTGSNIVYDISTWNGLVTTLDNNGAIRLQNQATPAVITIIKTARDSLKIIINSPLDGDRIITCKFTTQETIDAFNSLTNFGYADYLSDWTFSDQSIEGNLAPTIFFNYPNSTAGGGPISEINPVLRNIRVNVANPKTPATILTTNDQRYFYLDNVKIASWENGLSFDSLMANTPVVAYDVFSNRPVGSNVVTFGVYTQIPTIF